MELSKMELSLYGSTGFVGSHFLQNRILNGDYIHCIPRWSRRPAPTGDILYTISTTHNYHVFGNPTLDVDTNLRVFTETLESWKNNNPNAIFNFLSSWFVFGDGYELSTSPAYENSVCNPRGFYSITKYCAERLLVSYAETFGLKYRILRLGNVIGKGAEATAKKNAFQYLINKMKNNETIDVYEKGDFYRNYLHVFDVVSAIRLVIYMGKSNSIYNIGNPENYRFINMLNIAAKELGYTIPFNFIQQKEFHKQVQAKSFFMNTDKLQDLGFEPVFGMKEMILDCLNIELPKTENSYNASFQTVHSGKS